MNKILVTIGMALLLQVSAIMATSAVDHTTFTGYSKPTGGEGGSEITVSSASALISAASSSGKKVIKISGTISNALIICSNDKSFIGVGTDAKLVSSSFLIKDASNIIIRNITMNLPYPTIVKGSDHDGDVIHLEGTGASNVWIDHCEIFNKYDGVGKDDYDGLIDVKKGATKITISWCYIHDSWKTSLLGFTDKDQADWQIAFHHNLFNYVNSRIPSIRGGTAVCFNNYYLNIPSTAINCRMGAKVYIEKNYFDGVGTGKKEDLGYEEGPIGTYYSDAAGFWNVSDNYYTNCLGSQPTTSTCDYKPSFMNNASTILPVANVPAALKEFAGIVGKPKTLRLPEITPVQNPVTNNKQLQNKGSIPTAAYNILGVKVGETKIKNSNLTQGVFITKTNGKTVLNLSTTR